jgi:signal transduction histidine kinase
MDTEWREAGSITKKQKRLPAARELRAARAQIADDLRRIEALEQRVADRTKWLALMHDVTRALNDATTWDEGLQLVVQTICDVDVWQIGYVYLPAPDDPDTIVPRIGYVADERFRPFDLVARRQRFARGQSLPGHVYAEGIPKWLNREEDLLAMIPHRQQAARQVGLKAGVALPIRFGQDVMAVLELLSDQEHARNQVLADLMNDIGSQIGKVLEHERSTAQMADLVWREQQELLHTLHDSLGQTLAGLGMLASGLSQYASAEATDAARQIAQQAELALQQVRQLSRGLFPGDIGADNLVPALRDLASTTERFHGIQTRVESEMHESLRDDRVATQLYRIAQEAVTNAVKHARAGTIGINLSSDASTVRLVVVDDGVGIGAATSKTDGLGLRIMRYRATSVGAVLSIERVTAGGTAVTCTLRLAPAAGPRPAF